MIVIAFAQQKGGVMKSTLAIHLAVELVRRGKTVALLDVDKQGTVSKWAERRDAEQPHVETNVDAAAIPRRLTDIAGKGFDFAVLDLPGQSSALVSMGLAQSDFVVVPCRPLNLDVEASVETVRAVKHLKKPYAFALTIAPAGSPRTREFADGLMKQGQTVLPAFISHRLAFPDAVDAGKSVQETDPKGKATAEIVAFTDAVLKKVGK